MKKVFALVLAVSLTLSLAACGSASTAPAAAAGSGASTSGSASAASYKVAMVCDSSISDGGWGAACYNAMCATIVWCCSSYSSRRVFSPFM